MLMQDLTNLVVPSQLSQSLVLSSTKDLSSPQRLLVSFYTVSTRRLVLKPFIGNCNRANFTLQLLLLFANKFH